MQSTVTIAGPADAPAIMLIHGTRLTRAMWAPQLPLLSARYRVIVPDLPGHGTRAGESFSMEAAVASVAEALDAAGVQQALIAGLSLGGYLALLFSARYPERTRASVLAGCSYSFAAMGGRLMGMPYALAARVVMGLSGPIMARMEAQNFRRRYPPEITEPLIRAGFFYRPFPDVIRGLAELDVRPLLRALQTPTLLLNGEQDPLFRRGERLFLSCAPHAQLHLIAHAMHLCNLDQPQAFTDALLRFAAEHAPEHTAVVSSAELHRSAD